MTQAAKMKKLEQEVAQMKRTYGELYQLFHITLRQFKCKSCSLYHFPEPIVGCPDEGKAIPMMQAADR
jgi:hypothetical protein